MTGFMHEKEFSRTTFLKGGGALIVGFSLTGALAGGKAAARNARTAAGSDLCKRPLAQRQSDRADSTAVHGIGKNGSHCVLPGRYRHR